MRITTVVIAILLGIIIGSAGAVAIYTYSPTSPIAQLDELRRSLDAARADNTRITEGIGRAQNAIGDSIVRVANISNANQRAILLIGAIRSLSEELRKLVEGQEP